MSMKNKPMGTEDICKNTKTHFLLCVCGRENKPTVLLSWVSQLVTFTAAAAVPIPYILCSAEQQQKE